jgi:hypothetical protein
MMKISMKVISLLAAVCLAASGCSSLPGIKGELITPSKEIISEARSVENFSGIEMSALGVILLSQRNAVSLTVSGSDNLVPLIRTTVRDGVLVIEPVEDFMVTSFSDENMLTYTIVVKDLDSLVISGLGDVKIGTLAAPTLTLTMSGGGKVRISQLTTGELDLVLSGAGSVELAGVADQTTIEISGAGKVDSPDLKVRAAQVSVPGLGSATLWVTDQLTGNISGAGSVSYYGDPFTELSATGLGGFKSLGSK